MSTATDCDTLNAAVSHETATTDHPVAPDTPEGTAENVGENPKGENPNAEAAKWRRKLRNAETALATAHERIARYQRAAIEQAASTTLSVPSDLFDVGGVELTDLLDDNGDPDPDKVRAAVRELVALRPRLSKYAAGQTHPNWGQGQTGGTRGTGKGHWGTLLKG
ncbi:hypothetical protein [Nocardia otitidiscaviarum]|uniref:hypothetical protein n=1 Tax=Nocardia otitidiscaviarum TaxID=1823 RepID=UPI000301C290|nr:hypothetical protein [Nocardia otitidiscaviarum]